MGVCLLEVPTIQDDGVVNVFWVQKYLSLATSLEIEEGSSDLGRTLEHFGLEGRQLESGPTFGNST